MKISFGGKFGPFLGAGLVLVSCLGEVTLSTTSRFWPPVRERSRPHYSGTTVIPYASRPWNRYPKRIARPYIPPRINVHVACYGICPSQPRRGGMREGDDWVLWPEIRWSFHSDPLRIFEWRKQASMSFWRKCLVKPPTGGDCCAYTPIYIYIFVFDLLNIRIVYIYIYFLYTHMRVVVSVYVCWKYILGTVLVCEPILQTIKYIK